MARRSWWSALGFLPGVLDVHHNFIFAGPALIGSDREVTPLLHGVERVQHQSHENLDQLLVVAVDRRESCRQLAVHSDLLEALMMLQQEQGILENRRGVHRLLVLPSVG
jgi:hypothetical protein